MTLPDHLAMKYVTRTAANEKYKLEEYPFIKGLNPGTTSFL
jgi:hypothetical protein